MPLRLPARPIGPLGLAGLMASALVTTTVHAQEVPGRWHGQWQGAEGAAIAVSAQGFQMDGQSCVWRTAAPKALKGCVVHPDQPAEKAQLVRLLDDAEVALRKKGSPAAKAMLGRSRQSLAALPDKSFDAVAVAKAAASGCATYLFIDRAVLYRVLDCVDKPEAAQVVAYKKAP